MRRIRGRLAGGGAVLLWLVACSPDKSVGPRSPAFDAVETMVAPLVLHVVAPATTDPAIDRALDNHYVWLDTTARSHHKLFVFLPGTRQNPSSFQLVQHEAPSSLATHLTPAERYYGIPHDRDGFCRPILAGWDSLGLDVFGAPATPESSSPPYDGRHMLVTGLTPQGGFVGTNAHGAPSNDLNTPLGPDGTPLLRDAWRYLLTARGVGHEDADPDEIASGGGR